MNRFGFTSPLLMNEKTGKLVAGHGRIETLKQKKQFNESLDALGKRAVGASDVSELRLVDRYIDIVQRTWADVLAQAGQLAAAARSRQDRLDVPAQIHGGQRPSHEHITPHRRVLHADDGEGGAAGVPPRLRDLRDAATGVGEAYSWRELLVYE